MEHIHPQGSHPGHHGVAHEHSDISVRGVFIFAFALLVLAAVLHVTLWGLMGRFADRAHKTAEARDQLLVNDPGQFPSPRLQESPAQDLTEMRDEEKGALADYGWVDRKAGIVKIPVQRAMKILAQKGLPTRGDSPKSEPQPKSR